MQKISQELIGKKIKRERKKQSFTQDKLGERMFMSCSRVCHMESEEAISLQKLELAANTLNIDFRVLFLMNSFEEYLGQLKGRLSFAILDLLHELLSDEMKKELLMEDSR